MEWPVWYCLTPECREALTKMQKRLYKTQLQQPFFNPDLESLEEIGKIMRDSPQTSYEKEASHGKTA